MQFSYVAYRTTGEVVRGLVEADSEAAAEEALWQSNLSVVRLDRKRQMPAKEDLLPTVFGVRRGHVITFSHEFATLLTSGIPLVGALRMLIEPLPNVLFQRAITSIVEDLETGTRLSDAFAKYPAIFPPLYLRLLAVGEETGNLETLLREVVTYMEKEEAIINKIRGAVAYPAFIFALAIGATLVMMNFVLPALTGLFSEFGSELPLMTRIMVAVSRFTQRNFTYMVAGIGAAVALLVLYRRTREGARRIDYLLTRIPFVGNVVIVGNMSRMSRTMATLLQAGVSLTETIDVVISTSGNARIREALKRVRGKIIGGTALSDALRDESVIPVMVTQMIHVGEETGTLEPNLAHLAEFFEAQADRAVSAMTGVLEPAMIIVVGVIVSVVAISIIQPMYSILQRVR